MEKDDKESTLRMNVSSGTGLPGCPGQMAIKWLLYAARRQVYLEK